MIQWLIKLWRWLFWPRGSQLSVQANVTCYVRDAKTRELLRVVKAKNLLVNTGRVLVRDLLGGTGFRPTEQAIGASATAPTAGDTDLGSKTLTKTIDRRIEQTYGIDFQTLIETGEGNGTTIAEVGIFEGATLIARSVLGTAIPKTAAIEVTVSHVLTVNAG
jgi:hypothetical protein